MAEPSLIVKVTLVLVLTLLATRLASRTAASVRSLILGCAFGLLLILPFASLALPVRDIAVPASYSTALMPARLGVATPAPAAATVAHDMAAASPTAVGMPSMPALVRLAWAAGALAFMMPLLVGLIRLRRLRAGARPWPREPLLSGVDVWLHDSVHAPMTYGVRHQTIVLPAEAVDWSEADLRRALLHELEHLRRRDWPLHVAARAVCSLYWFHPLVWIAWRQLCLESERACDDAVLRESESTEYAAQLVSLARRIKGRSAIPLLSMANESRLSTRVGAVLAQGVVRGRVGRLAALVITGLTLAVALTISPLRVVMLAGVVSPQATNPAAGFTVTSIQRTQQGASDSGNHCCLLRFAEGGQVSGTNVGLANLIAQAYGVYLWQILGDPAWADADNFGIGGDRFDVRATARRDASPDDMRQMLQTMLADRFRLAVHRETRTGKVYELVVDPGGHKLPPPSGEYDRNRDVWMRADVATNVATLRLDRVTMTELARNLGTPLQAMVLDRTGLTGAYTVHARWTAEISPPPRTTKPGEPGAVDGPTILDAFRDQLGLRLRETTGPMEYLVIDRAERPTLN